MSLELEAHAYRIILIIHFVFTIPGFIWFWILRDTFPVKQRKPYFVIFAGICFLMAQQLTHVRLAFEDSNKGLLRMFTNLLFFIALHIQALRLFLLYFWELVTRLSVQFYNSDAIFAKDYKKNDKWSKACKWILNNRQLLNDMFWLICFISSALFAFLLSCIFLFRYPQVLSRSASIDLLDRFNSSSRVYMSVYSVFCVIIPLALMIYSMRGFEDNFYIKLEFKWSILVALINVLCSGLGSYFATRPDLIRIIPIVSGVIPLFFYIVVSIYLVIYWTYSHKRKFNRKRRKSSADSVDCSLASASGTTRRNSTASLKDDLKSMLKNKVARDNFLEFLKKEFSVENILLYDACTKFKKMISDAPQQLAWEYACEIYEKFIDPRGPLTVNISDTSRRKLSISFESNEALSEGIPIASIVTTTSDEQISKNHKPIPADFSAEIFEEAQQEILNLLATDSFLRFKQQSTFSPRWLSSTI